MSRPEPHIKSMGLYRNVERILADLQHAGLAGDAPLVVEDLVPYDQYHYQGTDADDVAAKRAGSTGSCRCWASSPSTTDRSCSRAAAKLFCDYLPDLDTYRSDMVNAGFAIDRDPAA